MSTLFEEVREVIVELIAVDKDRITLDAAFVDDLDADSLDMVNLYEALAQRFSRADRVIEISEDDKEQITTVRQLVDLLHAKGAG
jgi:acyl carrier protein